MKYIRAIKQPGIFKIIQLNKREKTVYLNRLFIFVLPQKRQFFMKKFFVLAVLFILPIVAYLFFASGVNNFAKLPVLTTGVKDISHLEAIDDQPVTFEDRISIVAFFGDDLNALMGNTFNLDKKILTHFYEFKDFQFVIILPREAETQALKFIEEFRGVTNSQNWTVVFGREEEVKEIFSSFETNLQLDNNLQTPFVFIVDKDKNLRGRNDDKDRGMVYGYDSRSVFELNDKMKDDVKVILAEYRLALKKYNKSEETEL